MTKPRTYLGRAGRFLQNINSKCLCYIWNLYVGDGSLYSVVTNVISLRVRISFKTSKLSFLTVLSMLYLLEVIRNNKRKLAEAYLEKVCILFAKLVMYGNMFILDENR